MTSFLVETFTNSYIQLDCEQSLFRSKICEGLRENYESIRVAKLRAASCTDVKRAALGQSTLQGSQPSHLLL